MSGRHARGGRSRTLAATIIAQRSWEQERLARETSVCMSNSCMPRHNLTQGQATAYGCSDILNKSPYKSGCKQRSSSGRTGAWMGTNAEIMAGLRVAEH